MLDLLNQIDAIVWGPWLLVLLVGTGVYLTIRLRLLQMVKLPGALRLIFFARNKGDGDIDSFKALCTALAATVGTGNIVGVATAIKLGGPGALFWMWVAAFFGMATKYAEGCLAVKFRSIDENGNIAGGPMYYIEQGLGKKWKPLALAFAFFGTLTAMLGSGTTTQVNAITSSLQASMGVPILPSAAVITILVAIITFGGLKSISKTAEKIVPAMAVLYFIITVALLTALLKVRQQPADLPVRALCLLCEAVSPAAFFPMNPAWVPRQSWRQRQKRNGRLNRVLFP